MNWRYQLPVSSQTRLSTLVRALPYVIDRSDEPRSNLQHRLRNDLQSDVVILTQSGTAALVLAIRQTVAAGGTLALPAYGCADLAAAAIRARVRVRLYDIEPSSLLPDLESLERTLSRKVDAVVVTHLFGVPVDVGAVGALALRHGAAVIEDAAQGLGSSVRQCPGGSLADRSVLSFGRGKGVSGGAGGALLLRGDAVRNASGAVSGTLPKASSGLRPLVMTAAQWLVGQPSVYRIPANLPFLHLGEMVYKDAPEPADMPVPCALLAMESLITLPKRVIGQRAIAAAYAEVVPSNCAIRPSSFAAPSWLRYPVLLSEQTVIPNALGVLRGYPAALSEQRHITAVLCDDEPDMPGAKELGRKLVTLPTHELMTAADVGRVKHWIERV